MGRAQPALVEPAGPYDRGAMTRLLIARHGETDWNREGRWQGLEPQPLNELGRLQARALARRLAAAGIDALYSSDLERAVQTAAEVSEACGVPVEVDARLREIDVGDWQGRTRAEVRATDPDGHAAWERGRLNAYPGGESFVELRLRTAAVFAQIEESTSGGTAAVVCHGGSIRSIVAEWLAMPEDGQRLLATGPNCSLCEFRIDHGVRRLIRLNDASHIPETG
jgi:probable phosphoglycerate mutase